MAKDVKFNIKLILDGKEQVVQASTNVKELAGNLNSVKYEGERLRGAFEKIASSVISFQGLSLGVQQLVGVLHEYSSANAEGEVAAGRLAATMRNTMGAAQGDVDVILELCAAQQALGVVEDDVQVAGAQELATYLRKRSSLEALIPVMNDMVAQQYGLNATQESATSIATMLGKVMDGQVGALSRYGYRFDAAQEQILKFGSEEERVAVLSDVVSSAVGGVNAALAQTDAGRAQQMANSIGDWKEEVGALVGRYEPLINVVGSASMAVAGMGSVFGGVRGVLVGVVGLTRSLGSFVVGLTNATGRHTVVQGLNNRALTLGTAALIRWSAGARAGAVASGVMAAGCRVLGAALGNLGLVSAIAVGVMGLVGVVESLRGSAQEAAESVGGMGSAAEAAARQGEALKAVEDASGRAYADASASLHVYREKLEGLLEKKRLGQDVSVEEKRMVGELNGKYGETMGYFASVSGWYDALVANSEAYCRQMVLEARTRELANQIAKKEQAKREVVYNADGSKKRYSTAREWVVTGKRVKGGGLGPNAYSFGQEGGVEYTGYYKVGTSERDKASALYQRLEKEQRELEQQLRAAGKEVAGLSFRVRGSATGPVGGTAVPARGSGGARGVGGGVAGLVERPVLRGDYENNVRYYEQELGKVRVDDVGRIEELKALKREAEEALRVFREVGDVEVVPKVHPESVRGLQERLQGAKRELEELPRTVPYIMARIEAQARVDELQRQVDEATRGEISISADVKGGYIVRGSVEDRRVSYEHAVGRVNRIREDVEVGIVGKDRALEEIGLINEELRKLGLKPITVELDSRGAGKVEERVRGATDAVGQLGSSLSGLGSEIEVPELNVAGVLAQAIATMTAGYADATAKSAALGPWAWLAFGATGLAQLVAMIGAVKGLNAFATGGIVGGGQRSGDRVLARVNSGEMILNMSQQARLFRLATGAEGLRGGMAGDVLGGVPWDVLGGVPWDVLGGDAGGGSVRFEIEGRKLVGVLANETRVSGVSGKRTKIRL